VTDSSQPIAGWYPDPENSAAERWWDGAAWSDHRRASTVAPAAPAAPEAPVAPAAAAPEMPAPADGTTGFAAPGASLSGSAPTADAGTPSGAATVSPYGTPAPVTTPAYAYGSPTAPAAPPAPNPYGAPAYAPAAPSNSLAVVGLVLALGGLLISFGGLTPLAGGIISTIALRRASKMRARGEAGHRWGMALAGTICGYAFFVLILGLIIFAIAFSVSQSGSSYNDF